MVAKNKNEWIIQCDNCGKEYDIPEKISTCLEDMEGTKQLVLETAPICPFCNTMNSRLAKHII